MTLYRSRCLAKVCSLLDKECENKLKQCQTLLNTAQNDKELSCKALVQVDF